MVSLPKFLRNGLLVFLFSILLVACKNNAPYLVHNFEADTIIVDHGADLNFDLRFLDDKEELINAKVSFDGDELYNDSDTIFNFDVNTANLLAGDYNILMYALDDDENESNKTLLLRVNAIKPIVGRVLVTNVRATEVNADFDIISGGGVDILERGITYSVNGDDGVEKRIIIEGDNMHIDEIVDGFPRKSMIKLKSYVTNSVGTSYSNSLDIITQDGIPNVVTLGISDIHSENVIAAGNVRKDGGANLIRYGICYSTDPEPTINDKLVKGIKWNINLMLPSLTKFTKYYYRAFAINRFATVYGDISEFETTGPPTVITGEHGRIMVSSIAFEINVSDDGGHEVTDAGIVYSMLKDPTLDSQISSFGKGSGMHSSIVTNLDPGSKYFMRSFAVNSEGVSYGEELVLFTKLGIPEVIIDGVKDIDYSSAVILANVPDDGGLDVIERGIVWDTCALPNKDNNYTVVEGTDGTFESDITGLVAGQKYFARAYALNEKGIVYSDALDFVPYLKTEMTNIKGGTFRMGSDDGDKTENPVHEVSLSSYQIGKYEVSNLEYANFLNSMIDRITIEGEGDIINVDGMPVYHLNVYGEDYDKTGFKVPIAYEDGKFFVNNDCTGLPAILVTWEGARMFCEWAGGRLPSEAEWEYAAKGAKNSGSKYSGGNDLARIGWYIKNSKNAACPLMDDSRGLNRSGEKKPNSIDLYDMTGNAAEWCYDIYSNSYYEESVPENPMGPEKGIFRVIRGGSWADREKDCTVYRRIKSFDTTRGYDNVSFRLVRLVKIDD